MMIININNIILLYIGLLHPNNIELGKKVLCIQR